MREIPDRSNQGKKQVALVASRREGETWRQAAARQARDAGLEAEVLEAFDEHTDAGHDAPRACWMALYDWDCLSLGEVPIDDGEGGTVPETRVEPSDVGGRS